MLVATITSLYDLTIQLFTQFTSHDRLPICIISGWRRKCSFTIAERSRPGDADPAPDQHTRDEPDRAGLTNPAFSWATGHADPRQLNPSEHSVDARSACSPGTSCPAARPTETPTGLWGRPDQPSCASGIPGLNTSSSYMCFDDSSLRFTQNIANDCIKETGNCAHSNICPQAKLY